WIPAFPVVREPAGAVRGTAPGLCRTHTRPPEAAAEPGRDPQHVGPTAIQPAESVPVRDPGGPHRLGEHRQLLRWVLRRLRSRRLRVRLFLGTFGNLTRIRCRPRHILAVGCRLLGTGGRFPQPDPSQPRGHLRRGRREGLPRVLRPRHRHRGQRGRGQDGGCGRLRFCRFEATAAALRSDRQAQLTVPAARGSADLVEALTWLQRPPRRRRRGELSFSSAPIPCRTRLWSEDHSLPSLSSAASRPLLIWSSNFPPVTLLAASAALSRPWSLICSPLSLFMASLALLVRSSSPILSPFIGKGSKRTF